MEVVVAESPHYITEKFQEHVIIVEHDIARAYCVRADLQP